MKSRLLTGKLNHIYKKYNKFTIYVLIIALVIMYIVYSVFWWSKYESNYQTVLRNVKEEVKTSFIDKDKVTSDGLESLYTSLSSQAKNICNGSVVVDWQTAIIDNLKSKVSDCQLLKSKIQDISRSVYDVSVRVKNEIKIVSVIDSLNTQLSKVSGTDFEKSKSVWVSARESISKISVDYSLEVNKRGIILAIKDIENALDRVIDADKSKDALKFDEASDNLKKSYAKFADVSSESNKSFNDLLGSIVKSADSL